MSFAEPGAEARPSPLAPAGPRRADAAADGGQGSGRRRRQGRACRRCGRSCSRCSPARSSPSARCSRPRSSAGAAGAIPFGVARLLAGIVFCLGLILVVVAGAELFTGNNLIVMAWAERRVTRGAAACATGGSSTPATWSARSPRWLLVFARRPVRVRRRRGRHERAGDRRREDEPRLRPGGGARDHVQRARLPRDLAHLQRPLGDRQDPRRPLPDHAPSSPPASSTASPTCTSCPMGLLVRDQGSSEFFARQRRQPRATIPTSPSPTRSSTT